MTQDESTVIHISPGLLDMEKMSKVNEEPIKIKKKRLVYSQNWSAYNEAQTTEKDFLMKILDELLCYLPVEEREGKGRPSVSLRDQVFSLCLQQYIGLSSRRMTCDIKQAHKKHYLFQSIHFNTLLKFYNNELLTPIIKQLIEISSTPLATVETRFAVDSSGFGTSMFERWFDIKYGKHSNRRSFKKAHITSGVKTNIITAVAITHSFSGDSPELPNMIRTTNKYFNIVEVSADKAYSSRKNLDLINQIGAVPYIPFKKNATGLSRGSMFWSRMYRYFISKQEEFMQHYHVRSNVETTFSMIKRKMNVQLRTKNEVSQTNEILIKCLVHNLCVLIQEYFKLGIDIDFSILCANGINVQP